MNKKYIVLFVLLFIVILTVGIFAIKKLKQTKQESETVAIEEEYTPEEEISEEQNQTSQTIVTLYFTNKETKKVMPEAQTVDVREVVNNPYKLLLELLIKGPKSDKLEKTLPENTLILGTSMENNCLTINLSKEILNYNQEDENAKENLIESIVNTMTELNEVSKVKIIVEGNESEEFSNTYERNVSQ